MGRIAFIGVAVAALAFTPGIPTASADQPVCYPTSPGSGCALYSPSHKLSCEMHYGEGWIPDEVFCENASQAVTLDAGGGLTNCTHDSCVGNPGIGTPTLSYGQTAAVGPFSCLSAESGLTCTVGSCGFTISASGITPV